MNSRRDSWVHIWRLLMELPPDEPVHSPTTPPFSPDSASRFCKGASYSKIALPSTCRLPVRASGQGFPSMARIFTKARAFITPLREQEIMTDERGCCQPSLPASGRSGDPP